jgi:hypothetical protein
MKPGFRIIDDSEPFVPDVPNVDAGMPAVTRSSRIYSKHSAEVLLLMAHKFLDVIEKAERRVNLARIEAGRVLLELRYQIEASGLRWWEYYQDHFARSRRDAERLMQIASAEDPVEAYKAQGARNAAAVAAHRERKQLAQQDVTPPRLTCKAQLEPAIEAVEPEIYAPEPKTKLPSRSKRYPEAPEDVALIGDILDRFRRLSWGGRVKAMQAINEQYAQWQRTGGK